MTVPLRLLLIVMTAAVPLGLSSSAHAQSYDITMTLALPDENNEGEFLETTNDEVIEEHFNLARCVCDEAFAVVLRLGDFTEPLPTEPVEIWVGNNCDNDDVALRADCEKVTEFADIDELRSRVTLPISIKQLLGLGTGQCPIDETTGRVWALVDENDDDLYDYRNSIEISADTQAPPEPSEIEARGAEEAIFVGWSLSESRNQDFESYQVLCAPADGSPHPDGFTPKERLYLTSTILCGDPGDGVFPQPFGVDPPDAGIPDSGIPDSGSIDGSVLDAGAPDGGIPDAARPDGATMPPPPGIDSLDEMLICGSATESSTSLRSEGLVNGTEYRVVWLGIDKSQNAIALDLGTVTPAAVKDGWENYKDSGGTAEGGFCFVATAAFGNYDHPYVLVLRDFRDDVLAKSGWGRAFIGWYYDNSPGLAGFISEHRAAQVTAAILLFPVVVAAGAIVYTGVLGKLGLLLAFGLLISLRRMRRRRKGEDSAAEPTTSEPRRSRRRLRLAAAGAVAALVLVVSSAASAQEYYLDEYDDDFVDEVGDAPVKWNLELRFGPYSPDVDSEFSLADGEEGPFEQMYGDGPFFMSQVSLDRFFLWKFGQIGVSVGAGFMTRSASAFEVDPNTGMVVLDANGNPQRSQGDKTGFRLVPTYLLAAYRLTAIDDQFHVPLIPYLKAGLSYYIWWMTAPDGSLAEVSTPMCDVTNPNADCDGDKARGGSLGYQATIGLAVRAERLDPDAELSLRNDLGIYHAGFFVEGTLAKVDGFGSDKKLSVGDVTWYAGVNFEF